MGFVTADVSKSSTRSKARSTDGKLLGQLAIGRKSYTVRDIVPDRQVLDIKKQVPKADDIDVVSILFYSFQQFEEHEDIREYRIPDFGDISGIDYDPDEFDGPRLPPDDADFST